MALIKCPECGKEISDKAVQCPNCGCPVSTFQHKSIVPNLTAVASTTSNEESIITLREHQSSHTALYGKIFVALILIVLLVIGGFVGYKHTKRAKDSYYAAQRLDRSSLNGKYSDLDLDIMANRPEGLYGDLLERISINERVGLEPYDLKQKMISKRRAKSDNILWNLIGQLD